MEIFITTRCDDCVHESVCKYQEKMNRHMTVYDTQLLLDTVKSTLFPGSEYIPPVYKCIIRCDKHDTATHGSLT